MRIKLKRLVALVALVAVVAASGGVYAADQKIDVYENQKLIKSVVFRIGVPYYVVNGQTPGVKMDVAPFIHNDRTLPAHAGRNIFENSSIHPPAGNQLGDLLLRSASVNLRPKGLPCDEGNYPC